MATQIEYPTSDGKPMAETEVHRDLMIDLIETLKTWFAADPDVYVSGNLLLFYEEGNKKKHVSPDVLVTLGLPQLPQRLYYLLWEEGKAPNFIIELTSRTTRGEDRRTKWELYRDVLKVPEYFLFDPYEEYLKPSMQGYRLAEGEYIPIEALAGRLPSEELGLHLERDGTQLRLFDPLTGQWLPTPRERTAAAQAVADAESRARRRAEAKAKSAEAKAKSAEAKAKSAEAKADAEALARQRAETEAERMRREIEALRRRLGASADRNDESAQGT